MNHTAFAATPKQSQFILRLLAEKAVKPEAAERLARRIDDEDVTKREASTYIEWLMAQPRKQQEAPVATAAPTVEVAPLELDKLYEFDGKVYRIFKSRSTGSFYAKVSDDGQWVYAPGVVRQLTADMRITLDRALELSKISSRCVRCHKRIEVEKSVRQGMGPVCIKKI